MCLNGGPAFKLSPAVSFMVYCRTQREIDYFWRRLSSGGKPGVCGWLTDRFGVSWQVVPEALKRMQRTRDKGKLERVMAVVMKSRKFDIRMLERAYRGS